MKKVVFFVCVNRKSGYCIPCGKHMILKYLVYLFVVAEGYVIKISWEQSQVIGFCFDTRCL